MWSSSSFNSHGFLKKVGLTDDSRAPLEERSRVNSNKVKDIVYFPGLFTSFLITCGANVEIDGHPQRNPTHCQADHRRQRCPYPGRHLCRDPLNIQHAKANYRYP
ncbi:expressed unknown protein [Seminavis robusta]|uniref:Uncharacterized protein n=1 Tax=Seminavis robusta TaxID=568900 RepID=A0A9N8HED0_9STRA|nr:expressed unknown protein [Seminavis robusta]|eukprot:Sro382_g131000.1 n/a (105) ;mRNA; r:19667-20146